MKAQSNVYIKLQNIYKTKARQDLDEVLKIARATAGARDVDPAEVELFCKNAAFVKLINATGGARGTTSVGSVDQLAKVAGKSFLACGLCNHAVSTTAFRLSSARGGRRGPR